MATAEVWAGFECTRVRVRRRIVDQLALTGHDSRSADIELVRSLGVQAVRYPVLWERVAPRGADAADWRWPDERLRTLRDAGVRPIVGLLHHGGGPPGMSLLHPLFPRAFGRFAGAVARRYPWIDSYIPINEPLTTARFSGLSGFWHPHARSGETFAELILAQILAIRSAIEEIRQASPAATLIVNEDVARTFGTPVLANTIAFLNARRWLTWDLLLGRVDGHHPLHEVLAVSPRTRAALASLLDRPCPPDVLGVDHYVTSDRFVDHRVESYPIARQPSDPTVGYVDVEAVRVAGLPDGGIAAAIEDTWDRYRKPLALTEVSLAGPPDDQVAWWHEAVGAVATARRRGVDVRAVTAWAVMGATDWHSLMCDRHDRYEPGCFDVRTSPPARRPLADAIRATAERRAIWGDGQDLRSAPSAGWWRRGDRFLWSGITDAA